jgi:hypothetical protein
MELLRNVGHVESHFGPFGDGVSVGERLVHGLRQTFHRLEINLDAPDVTPSLQGSSGSSFWSF